MAQRPPGRFRSKIQSDPFHGKTPEQISTRQHSKAFPDKFTYAGYLDVRSNPRKNWKRRYFVLSNNFMLCAATEHAEQLERVIPLEGSNLKGHTKTSDMTFELITKRHPVYFRAPSPQQCERWTHEVEKASTLKIKDIYRFLYTLGTSESQNTKVVAAKHRTTNEDCAIKIVDKRTCDQRMLRSEIQILKKCDSDFLIRMYDLFETKKFLYIVMEKCEGGELFDQIAELDGDHYSEEDCCGVMHQIARGVKHMHENGIVHRDLKPENILCVEPNSIRHVKIADFGISKMLKRRNVMTTMVGTLTYTAPEILRGKGYDKSVDYWAVGVIMYILLCGYTPFYGDDDQELRREILKGEIQYEDEDWEHVSNPTVELVQGLLHRIPRRRASVDDILRLTWTVSPTKSWSISRTKFKKTVANRKLHRMSMSALETKSKNMPMCRDDMSMHGSRGTLDAPKQPHDFVSRRGSKCTESLVDLNITKKLERGLSALEDMEQEN